MDRMKYLQQMQLDEFRKKIQAGPILIPFSQVKEPIWEPETPEMKEYRQLMAQRAKEEREANFRKECRENVQKMLQAFTFDEHMSIAFTPHVIIDTIWFFVDKVQNYCREHRVSEVKKLSRAINELRTRYREELRKDLSQKHLDQIHEKSENWRELNSHDMTIMFFAMGNTLLKEYRSQDYLDCMNWAYTAMKLCNLAKKYNEEVNQMIRERLGEAKDAPPHWIIDKLYAIMDAHLPADFKVDDTQIDICMGIFRNNLRKLKYQEI